MANFTDFDVEIADNKDSSPEHKNGSVTTAGTPVTVSRTDAKNSQLVFINNPSKGVNANAINAVLYVSIDGGVTYVSLARGESQHFPGVIVNGNLKINASANGVKYEAILWG
jgi:hypothetical protein